MCLFYGEIMRKTMYMIVITLISLFAITARVNAHTPGYISSSPKLAGACTSDINQDGIVNMTDIQTIASAYGTSVGQVGYNPAADINNDGTIDILDLAYVAYHYQEVCPPYKHNS